jgi:hypothetical protein
MFCVLLRPFCKNSSCMSICSVQRLQTERSLVKLNAFLLSASD